MVTLKMLKWNAFADAMGRTPWESHTIGGDFISEELAVLTAGDLVRSVNRDRVVYGGAEIYRGSEFVALGSLFDGELVWA